MAKKKRKSARSGKGTKKQKKERRAHKGQIPLPILEKRAKKLARLVISRGGNPAI